MPTIETITARQIYDSRATPTIEADVLVKHAGRTFLGRAAVPSGASTGKREALELRDRDPTRFRGKGVEKAVFNVNSILAPALLGLGTNQSAIDRLITEMDGTDNLSCLGANAVLSVSLAVAKATAEAKRMPFYEYIGELCGIRQPRLLPVPLMNVMNGGAHVDIDPDLRLDFQELMITPLKADSFKEALQMGARVFHYLGTIVESAGFGDEGGYIPTNFGTKSGTQKVGIGMEFLIQAIEKSGYHPGEDVVIALDAAASQFFKNGKYHLSGGEVLTPSEMVSFYRNLIKKYSRIIISIEDGMAEEDEAGWLELTRSLGNVIQLVGDDLFVTNPIFFKNGINRGLANSILIKLNQIGTLTRTLEVIDLARRSGYSSVGSHRSGETEDTTLAHLVVGAKTGQIKTGAPQFVERTAKYNELLRIEEKLGPQAIFAGITAFRRN